MLSQLAGSMIIARTPFDERRAIHQAVINNLTDFRIGQGFDGLVVLGVSGKSRKLTPEEIFDVARRFIARTAGKSVIVEVLLERLARLLYGISR